MKNNNDSNKTEKNESTVLSEKIDNINKAIDEKLKQLKEQADNNTGDEAKADSSTDNSDSKADESKNSEESQDETKITSEEKNKDDNDIDKNTEEDKKDNSEDVDDKNSKDKADDNKDNKSEQEDNSKADKTEISDEKETGIKEDKQDNETAEKKDIANDVTEPFVDSSVYKHKKRKGILKIVFGVIFSLLIICYFAGVYYFSNHFGRNTYINDIDVSFKSVDEVKEIFETEMNKYQLEIIFKDGKEVLKNGDGGIYLTFKKEIEDLRKQNNAFLWFVDLFTENYYKEEYKVNYDKAELSSYILDMDYFAPFRMQPSIDAKVDLIGGEVVVTPEQLGTLMDKDLVMDVICSALDSYLEKVDLVSANCYIPAEITEESESIINTKKNAEVYLSTKAIMDFGDYKYQIPREDLASMARLTENGEIEIVKHNVDLYVQKFDKKFTTMGTYRKFVTHEGKTILINGDDYYGWVMDPEREAEELYDLMIQKRDFTKEVACKVRGYAMSDLNDVGSSYVEVDLADQHVYLYINGRLIHDCDCVSGRPSMMTPGGIYGLTYKAYDATLKGEDYETKVNFWMPFNWDIGLHDATWRAEFGGDIYTYDGSHGCVNLPYESAQKIFDYIDGEFPIVCYWDNEVEEVTDTEE